MPADSIFFDGFDHYSTSEIPLKWDGIAGYNSTNNTIDQTAGRNGKGCFSVHQGYIYKNVTRTKYFIVAFALKMLDTSGVFLNISDTIGSGAQIVGLRWNSDNTISIYSPQSGSAFGTTTGTFSFNHWYYIEFKIHINSTTDTGWCQLRADGAVVLDLSTQNTTWGTSNQANQVFVGSLSGAINSFALLIDDFVLQTGSGANYLGDVVIESLYANADGNYTNFSPTGSSNRYNCVNEHPPDDDTTYINTTNIGDLNTFQFTDTSESILAVKGVQTVVMARKSGTGSKVIAPVFRIGGTDYVGDDVTLGSSYSMARQVYTTSPATGVAWTATEITNIESGVKVTG